MKSLNKIKKVNNKNIQDIVNLHRKVVSETNAKLYDKRIIAEWLSQITPENVRNQLKVRTTSWYLIELDNKIIGFCQFPIAKKLIYQLNIDPNYQGKGYGRILYDFMEQKFKEVGINLIELNSTINARPFYERLGFKVVRTIRYKLIDTEMDMFEMKKSL